ncbi:putative cytosine deaminase FCY1 [Scheffersomyces coipomensis]|uniref:putative cytosine deaminase FCY1 n=1 Tax=Scheffersomyces coipomensis TaxID=1788519 RepID=UPI00315C5769
MAVNVSDFELIESAEDHIYEIYSIRAAPSGQDLGYVNKSKHEIQISLDISEIDLTIKQSLSSLSSAQSSTGFVCWQSATYFLDWLIGFESGPFYSMFNNKNSNLTVVELGTGVSGICASILGPRVARYIATDQKHILKLLQENINDNVVMVDSKKSTKKSTKIPPPHKIEVIEFDWEDIDQGLYNCQSLGQSSSLPDIIIACDTIYNHYLIPHFINALKSLMSSTTIALVALQMRDPVTLEDFISQLLRSDLKVYVIPDHMLTERLQKGFLIYYITL